MAIATLEIGGSMIGPVIPAELTPRRPIECIFDSSPGSGDRHHAMQNIEPNINDYFSAHTKFFFLVAGICFVTVGGSKFGMTSRRGA